MNYGGIILVFLLALFYYQYQQSQPTQLKPKLKTEYGNLQNKPWLLSPFNQPTTVPQRNANTRIFDVDPQRWDVKEDPEYYLADLQQRYPDLKLKSDIVNNY